MTVPTTNVINSQSFALALAREPHTLAAIRSKLAENRLSCNLFDTERYTRHPEVATQECGRYISAARSKKASVSDKVFQRKKMTMQAIETQARILYPSCPLCSSPDIIAFLKADCTRHPLFNPILGPVMTWKKCRGCAHVFTEGYFTPDAARIIFSKTHDYQKTGSDIEKHRYISSRMVEKILAFADSGDWLDIGFGNGSLLFTAHEYGFNPVGIDLRESNVSALKQFGIEAHCIDLNKLDHQERYSVISMADVLEHIPYPKEALKSVHKLLKNDAVTLISLPNMDSVLWQTLNNANGNPYWGEIEHYHNFGRTRLYALLKECGFEPLLYGISHRYRACMEIIAKKMSS